MSTHQKRLRTARKRRHQIASLLDALKHERVTLETILADPPAYLGNVSINTVMKYTPRLGPEGIKKCLQPLKIWPEDKISTLTQEQREAIIKHLPARARKYDAA